MRRGCIAITEVNCSGCGRVIKHGERYLADDAKDGSLTRLCINCCTRKGFVGHKRERGQDVMTLFGESLETPAVPATAAAATDKPVKEKKAGRSKKVSTLSIEAIAAKKAND
jgi:hypothetical protein